MPSDCRPLYLDYNASTPLDPRVFEAMRPWFLDEPGNAGSRTHVYGSRAKAAVETARDQIALCIDRKPDEIIFTSGATESNNLALLGLRREASRVGRRHIISTAIEHKAVLEPLETLRKEGFDVELAPVTQGGYVEPDEIKSRLRSDTLLVSVMHANNETGVLQPVVEIGDLLADRDTLFHVDAAQSFGKEIESLTMVKCDLLSVSGHKIYGPKGIGALLVRRQARTRRVLEPIVYGGGQERGLRPGTLPVALIVGLGMAAELARAEYAERRFQAARMKEQLMGGFKQLDFRVNGDLSRSQAHVLNVSFVGIDSEALMLALREDVAISNGSACTASSYSPSHVLQAMGLGEDLISSAVRISWGQSIASIPVETIVAAVRSLRTSTTETRH